MWDFQRRTRFVLFEAFDILIRRCAVIAFKGANKTAAVRKAAFFCGVFDGLLLQQERDRIPQATFGEKFTERVFRIPFKIGHQGGSPDVQAFCES